MDFKYRGYDCRTKFAGGPIGIFYQGELITTVASAYEARKTIDEYHRAW